MEFKDLKVDVSKIRIESSLDIYEVMQALLQRETKIDIKTKEHFWTVSLNISNKIINIELISLGSVSKTVVDPKEILSIPLQKKARGIILVHNHPSGNLQPSEDDKDLTDLLIQACKIMCTPILDHIIITERSYLSFNDIGLLNKLKLSKKYALSHELEHRFYQKTEKLKKKYETDLKNLLTQKEEDKQSAITLERMAIAKKMLQKGKTIQEIIELTELTLSQINQLNP